MLTFSSASCQLNIRVFSLNSNKEIYEYYLYYEKNEAGINLLLTINQTNYKFNHKDLQKKFVYIYIDTLANNNCIEYYFGDSGGTGISFKRPDNNCENYNLYKAYEQEDISPMSNFQWSDFWNANIKNDFCLLSTIGYEYDGLTLGCQIKFFTQIPFLPASISIKYISIISGENNIYDAFGFDIRIFPVGISSSFIFSNGKYNYYLQPQLAFDAGTYHFSYGYNFTLRNELEIRPAANHSFNFGIGLNFSRPIKSLKGFE